MFYINYVSCNCTYSSSLLLKVEAIIPKSVNQLKNIKVLNSLPLISLKSQTRIIPKGNIYMFFCWINGVSAIKYRGVIYVWVTVISFLGMQFTPQALEQNH